MVFAKPALAVSTEEVSALLVALAVKKSHLDCDVCGKMSAESLRGAEYILSYIHRR